MLPPLTYKQDALHVNLYVVIFVSIVLRTFSPVCEILELLPLIGDRDDPAKWVRLSLPCRNVTVILISKISGDLDQQDTLTFTDLTPVEQILKNFRSCFKVLEYGIHYQTTSKMPRLLVYSSV